MRKEKQEEILWPFLVHDVARHRIELKLTRSSSQIVATDENGRFNEKIFVDSLEGLTLTGNRLTYTASDEHSNRRGDQGLIYLMKNEHGCSIISDIDDTIKISDVTDRKKLIINTFDKDFQVVPGNFDSIISSSFLSHESIQACQNSIVTGNHPTNV